MIKKILFFFSIIPLGIICYRGLHTDRKFTSLGLQTTIYTGTITTTGMTDTTGMIDTTGTTSTSGMEILAQNIAFFKDFPGLVHRQITYTNPNHENPMSNNMSDLFLSFTGNGVINVGGTVLEKNGIEFIQDDIYALDAEKIIVDGLVHNDAEIIEVIWDGDKQIQIIPGFTPGNKKFSFTISRKDNNLLPGMNKYLVRAYAKNRVYYSLIQITYYTAKQSFFGEKITITTPSDNDYGGTLPKVTKSLACKKENGLYKNNLESKWPGKNTLVGGFLKNQEILYYAVRASSSEHPNCEDSDFQLSLFTYDCGTKKSQELLTYGRVMDQRDGLCFINIIGGTGDSIVFRNLYYESSSLPSILTISSKNIETIQPFTYTNSSLLKKNIVSIQDKYALTSDGMEFLTFADMFEIKNCNDNLVCDLIYQRNIDENHFISYDAKIDIIHKRIQ